MSSKYEREIDEILRKFEDERPPTVRDRVSAMNRRPTPIRSTQRPTLPRIGTTFWLVTGIAVAFVAEIVRWIVQPSGGLLETLIGVAVVIGFVMIVTALISAWLRGNRPPVAAWRGSTLDQGGRGPNRSPFANLRTRWNLVKLRIGYRRKDR